MKLQAPPLHPDLQAGFTYLFNVNRGYREWENIGRFCRWRNPSCTSEHGTFVIGHLQYTYDGKLAYRVYSVQDNWGKILPVDDAEILPERKCRQ